MRARFGYAGASGRGSISSLRPSYVVQPKYDGAYATVTTDRTGRIANIILRSGRQLPPKLARDFRGIYIGAPDSVFHSELETHTEAANRHAARRGYRRLYVFDVSRLCRDDLTRLPYRERHDWLRRMRDHIQGETTDRAYADRYGNLHDAAGRFARDVPLAHRRYQVAPIAQASDAEDAWRHWVDREALGPCEGLVAVALDAPLGKRSAKLKIKPVETIDAVVVSDSRTRAMVSWQDRIFTVGSKGKNLAPGQIVELTHTGWYESSLTPRHPRITRVRSDLR